MKAPRRALVRTALVLLATVGGVSACSDKVDDEDRAIAAIRATTGQARTYRYVERVASTVEVRSEAAPGAAGGAAQGSVSAFQGSAYEVIVDGQVEDDLRYGGSVQVDGRPVLEQRVTDDAIAVRVLAADRLPAATGVGAEPVAAGSPGAGLVPDQALRAGRWIVDPDGAAPVLGVVERGGPVAGRDVVREANGYLPTAQGFLAEADRVVRFSEESIYYRPREDPFPKPDERAGELRFDLIRPPLPVPAAEAGGAAAAGGGAGPQTTQVPTAVHYRKLSVYVRDGRVVRVLERVALDERVDQTLRLLRTILEERRMPAAQRDALLDELARPGPEQEVAIVSFMNTLRSGDSRSEPIRLRTVELTVADQGSAVVVASPEDAVTGDLRPVFAKRDADGRPVVEEEASPGGRRNASSTTTSAPPGA